MDRSNLVRKALVGSGILVNLARLMVIPGCEVAEQPISDEQLPPASVAEFSPVSASGPFLAVGGATESGENERLGEIGQLLQQIPTGREALQVIEDHDVSVRFESGGGSYFAHLENRIIVDSQVDSLNGALMLVHEAAHARYFNAGQTAQALRLDRDDYVHHKAEEETEAQVNTLWAKIELEQGGIIDGQDASLLFETEFRGAQRETVGSEPRGSSDEEREALARQAGKEKMFRGIMDAKVVSSTLGVPYPATWAHEWVRINSLYLALSAAIKGSAASAEESTAGR